MRNHEKISLMSFLLKCTFPKTISLQLLIGQFPSWGFILYIGLLGGSLLKGDPFRVYSGHFSLERQKISETFLTNSKIQFSSKILPPGIPRTLLVKTPIGPPTFQIRIRAFVKADSHVAVYRYEHDDRPMVLAS